MDRINIALASDDRYFCGLLVTVCSIAKSASAADRLRFFILDGGVADADYSFLVRRANEYHANCEFRRIAVNEADFADCPSWNGSRLIYVRLMLPRLLPDVDWVIYCDVDFLWQRDIGELWRMRDDRYAFVGVLDPAGWVREAEERWCRERSLDCSANTYCCAGLSFLNLKMFRDEKLFERCLELNRLHPPYNDQTIFNVVTHGRKKLVGEEWQCFHWRMSRPIYTHGVVVHYAGNIPWKPLARKIHLLCDATILWHCMNAEIYGISTWQSLRRWMSASHILWHRGLYWLLQLPGAKGFVRWLCVAAGHPGVWRGMEPNARRIAVLTTIER